MNFSSSVLIILSTVAYSTHGFTGNTAIRHNNQHVFKPNNKSSLKVAEIIEYSSNVLESSSIDLSGSGEECSVMGKFFNECSNDPSLKAEVLSDVGHVLDMFPFISKEGSIISRLVAVIGRLAFIASDYIPDHAIRNDELVFQMSMLVIASARLSQCLSPMVHSIVSPTSSPSIREKKAYILLFKQVGLPWNKYKYIVNSNVLSWVNLRPNAAINEANNDKNNALYWIYNGTVYTENNQQVSRNSFISLDDDQKVSQFKAGNDGASLLKVDLEKLQKLMNEDDVLNDSVRNLLFEMLNQA